MAHVAYRYATLPLSRGLHVCMVLQRIRGVCLFGDSGMAFLRKHLDLVVWHKAFLAAVREGLFKTLDCNTKRPKNAGGQDSRERQESSLGKRCFLQHELMLRWGPLDTLGSYTGTTVRTKAATFCVYGDEPGL